MPQHSNPCLPEHFSFLQYTSGILRPIGEFLQALPQLLTAGPALDLKVSLLGLPTIMHKSQKGKLLGFLASLVRVLPCKAPEFDASCLLFRQFQPNPFEPVLKTLLKTLCILLVLKAGYKIVREAEVVRLPSTLPAYPPAEPQVQHIVQVDIRQQWRQDRTLRGPFLARMDQAAFHDATLEHTNDQPDDTLIPNAMLQKFDHPLMVDSIKESFDIGLYQVADFLLLDRPSQRIQTFVLVAPQSVRIAAVLEYGLVDRLQRPFGRFFHNLVFQIANPKRPTLLAARLRYIRPPLRFRM